MSQSRPSGRGSPAPHPGSGPRGASRRRRPRGPAHVRAPARPAGASRASGRRRGAARRGAPRLTGRAAILVLVLAVLMVSYASSMRAYLEQQRHLAALGQDIASSKADIASLQREKKRWNDPAYVRTVAHQRLGWVLPGEIGFQVLDDDGKPLGAHRHAVRPGVRDRGEPSAVVAVRLGERGRRRQARGGQADVPQPVTKIEPPKVSKR